MSDMNTIRVPGISAHVVVSPEYEWRELGSILAKGFDAEQADALDALAVGLRDLNAAQGLLQLQYVSDLITGNPEEYNIDAIKWLLSELLIRLEGADHDA